MAQKIWWREKKPFRPSMEGKKTKFFNLSKGNDYMYIDLEEGKNNFFVPFDTLDSQRTKSSDGLLCVCTAPSGRSKYLNLVHAVRDVFVLHSSRQALE